MNTLTSNKHGSVQKLAQKLTIGHLLPMYFGCNIKKKKWGGAAGNKKHTSIAREYRWTSRKTKTSKADIVLFLVD